MASRALDWRKYISADPDICHGKPCFKGTRIMVGTILELLEYGTSLSEIRSGYPGVTATHVQAAVQFAREFLERHRYWAFHPRHAISHR